VDLNERVRVSIGAVGNQRFGSEKAFEQIRPVISLTVLGAKSAFVFGTLPPRPVTSPMGPDRGGPHGLLPPLQRETLTFDRPHEAGLAWIFTGATIRSQFWLNWQRLNTEAHRERFDGGVNLSVRTRRLTLPVQVHVVHEGGQLHASGPVADSAAAAVGVNMSARLPASWRGSIELSGVASRHVPDRSRTDLRANGAALFGRASVEHVRWRGHVLFWRGRTFIKDEGDPNYLSITRSAERYNGTRDYSEAGLTRRFILTPGAVLEIAARIHRVESRYEYRAA
jgi:hypothetical protein